MCLAMKAGTKVPTSKEKSFLSSVGLGEKVIMFPSMQVICLMNSRIYFKDTTLSKKSPEVFDLLKCNPNTRELEEFLYMVTYPIPWIQQQVSSKRAYICPLQSDLRC